MKLKTKNCKNDIKTNPQRNMYEVQNSTNFRYFKIKITTCKFIHFWQLKQHCTPEIHYVYIWITHFSAVSLVEDNGWLHPTGVISLVSGPDYHGFAYWN